jgi:hypothetical protein
MTTVSPIYRGGMAISEAFELETVILCEPGNQTHGVQKPHTGAFRRDRSTEAAGPPDQSCLGWVFWPD